ncbi:MAG: HhoA/HhoB/HtrA family serine endopeptidase [Pseudanabaena sp.]|jgi:serine protease Do|uniref:HhoA/HhoB/HtrA family serine endopeptidase n=1 Tax=Pseudanabaena mucicola TaxID=71190 RepID=UPI0025754465|nr:HhoA/HhoB/HtrA family serine endopeptidase [Pseudanabaena mucicola]MCA6574677.1 trypsin-like peptidase domain-containing protein [Pseudanabaena sp. M53BS1SP1A06MG]MCA6584731.1 trypsin-like peptidase domain-containing protein [Pseudanabaena sp. M34BS1SP1A06MG]MCA6586736.1 trypsin-like peptidase domain-containing protein [Pseudanabaena sp. M051S1SP1A06QC]MCA6590168.1 trypsin-like peptidase domain-containing protein [Pseudanabaena sp. M109S1SP1A06QC]MCA6594209.1 trypsin-like peptidase domain-c
MRDSNKKSRYKQPLIYASMLLLGVILGAWAVVSGVRSPNMTVVTPLPQVASVSPAIAQDSDKAKSIAVPRNYVVDAVNRTGPAVVRINASRTVTNNQQIPDVFLEDPMFRQFFGDQLQRMPRERVERGTGSGFIINKEGDIITNAHVVSGADKVTVILKDGRQIEGKVIGSDELTDVAVVQVKADNLPTVSLGSSASLQPGDWAIAIGNPLGLDNTVTAGIVSAIGRKSGQIGVDKRVSFIQTDAAINPGNSGGPLLNQNGEVIGVNTAIIQGAQGLGFAIPIETAQRISKQLIQNGKVSRAYLGIQMVTVNPNVKKQVNQDANLGIQISEDTGVLITRVVEDSPAARAGAKRGDVIVKFDNQEIITADQVTQLVEDRAVGDKIRMEVKRNGQTISLNVEAAQFPQKFPN